MGCKQSTPQRSEPTAADPDEPPELTQAELIAKGIAKSAWDFVSSVSRGDALEADWRAFLSTCDYFMDRDLSATRSERRNAFDLVAKLCPGAPFIEPEKYVDDRLHSLIEAWAAVAEENGRDHLPRAKAAEVLTRAKVHCPLPAEGKSFTFGELVQAAYNETKNTGLDRLFDTVVSPGSEILSVEQLAAFASFGADVPMSIEEVRELTTKRLGGAVTRMRFLMFFGNSATNDVLDPKRALSVWQDMSQPLTHYSVATRSVSSMAELKTALTSGCRALVLHVSHVNKEGDPMMGDGKSLQAILHQLKQHAFITNPLPIVLCFLPDDGLSVAIQDAVATALTTELGDHLAPGLMFRGSQLSDPKFTPLGLQNRFLVMAQQGKLQPFVGFNVANMQRTGLGVRVTAVPEGTPAARAGIGKQDWLTHFNGEVIESKETLREKLLALHSGEEFRIRKEGLTEVTGIVGAAVGDMEGVSKKFASLLFLNYIDGTGHHHTNQGASPASANSLAAVDEAGDTPPLPWDTQAAELPTDGAASPSQSPDRRRAAAGSISRAGSPAAEIHEHFRFVNRRSVGTSDTDERERAVAEADLDGVQFIDTHSSPAAERWARGKFSDNGHCGYVLQSRSVQSGSSDAHSVAPFGDAEARSNGLSRHDDEPTGIHLDVELLALPGATLVAAAAGGGGAATAHPAYDPTCSLSLIGTPMAERAVLHVHGVINVRDPSGKVVLMRTVDSNGVELEAALPANLVRPGYRIISFYRHDDPTIVVPVLCAVKRHPASPAVTEELDDADESVAVPEASGEVAT